MSGKYALIIANTEYTDPGLAQLTAPGKDAEDFARVLGNKDICAFDDVKVLVNEHSNTVNEAIDEFFDQKKPDDLLLLYFSGHGVRDELGMLYLAVKNTNRYRLRVSAIKSDFIKESMDRSRSRRQVLILDCCNSGAFAQGTKAATGVSIGTASAFEAGYGRVILTASDSTQYAWEGDKVIGDTDNSLFTHYLVEGLEGNADRDGDGQITVDELYDYTYAKVRLATPKQTPSKFSDKQQGEIILRENIRIEDIKPIPLPDDLITAINSSLTFVREGAVRQLEELLKGRNRGLARTARDALVRIAEEDDSKTISRAALQALETVRQAEKRVKLESEQLAEENHLTDEAEKKRIAKAKLEAERLAEEKRLAEDSEKKRIAAQKVEEERITRAKLEAQRQAEEAEKKRFAVQKAEENRLAKAKLEAEQLSDEKRLAEEAEKQRIAAKQEDERLANAKLEADRLIEEKRLAEEDKKQRVAIHASGSNQAFQQKNFLKLSTIGIIGTCVLATGVFGAWMLLNTASPTPISPLEMNDLINSAKAEGTLNVIALPHDWCNYGEVIDTFKSKYGIEVNELDPDIGSFEEVEAIKANKENAGPQAPDVIDVGIAYGVSAKADGLLYPYKVSTWDSIPADVKDADGYWYGDYYGVISFLVNTDVQPDVPADWNDLLDPKYSGQIALSGDPRTSTQAFQTVFAASLANGGSLDNALPGLDFFAQLNNAGNLVPLISNNVLVATGETPIRITWDYNAHAAVDSFAGSPTAQVVIPDSGRFAIAYAQAISAYAPHPNAAKLWMEFLYSDEGQTIWMKGYCHPIREEDMRTRGVIPNELLAKLPDVSGAVFPTIDQLNTAKALITENWNTTVGADIQVAP